MARSRLFQQVQKLFRLAQQANRSHGMATAELIDRYHERVVDRRTFLKRAVAVGAMASVPLIISACSKLRSKHAKGIVSDELSKVVRHSHRIAIVGAGMAGLTAAYTLQQSGVQAQVYEASTRVGGRIFTTHGFLGEGLTTEFGGEFIDSNHADMLALAKAFQLPLIDDEVTSEQSLQTAFFFHGKHYTEKQVVDAFRPIAARMAIDSDSTGDVVNYANDGGAMALDRLSITEYLDTIGARGWIRELLEVAYVTEYGLDADKQSALNLLFLISTDVSEGTFGLFGESDQRYRIQGGNAQLPVAMANAIKGQLTYGHRLVAVRPRNNGYRLIFENTNRQTVEVDADVVVFAMPFTILRDVEIDVELPALKKKVITSLQYGTNAKAMAGFTTRVWRDQQYSGDLFSEASYQSGWDNSRLQGGKVGGFTFYLGGTPGVAVSKGSMKKQIGQYIAQADHVWKGLEAAHNGKSGLFHWPTYHYTKGSYACYTPGDWTTIAGAEGLPVGNLFFAGEHCSYDFQGYMNGAAESGRVAAEAILKKLS